MDQKNGFETAFAAWNRQALRPHILLDAATNGTMRTRFGGVSLGEAPLDTNGRPMRMLCAVDFAELPALPDFPQTGLLRIYVEDDALFGMDFDEPAAQRNFRVLYDADWGGLTPQEEPGESDYFPIPLCCPCRAATLEQQPIPYGNYRFEDAFDACCAATALRTSMGRWSAASRTRGGFNCPRSAAMRGSRRTTRAHLKKSGSAMIRCSCKFRTAISRTPCFLSLTAA